MKANFNIRLIRPIGFISFSNNPINHTEKNSEYEIDFKLKIFRKIKINNL
jgi:hypothetical protein